MGGGWGGIGGGGPPIKKWGPFFLIFFYRYFYSVPIQLSRRPEGPSRSPKATSPPQELEVGTCRAPYLLV